jgi:outer membrane scaffolding protein for murein synthesis (MipA/OmpV family)
MNYSGYLIAFALVSSGAMAQSDAAQSNFLGAAVRNRPLYDGANQKTTDVVPLVRYARGPWFVRTLPGILEGGARVQVGGGLAAGVQLAHEAGPRDADPGASVGAHLEWNGNAGPMPLNAMVRFRNHLDSDRGRELDARLTAGVYGNHGVRAGIFAGATWANKKHFGSYYDVPASGQLYTSVGALASYQLSAGWLLLGTAEARRLADKPAGSRFVEDRSNTYATIGVAYRF